MKKNLCVCACGLACALLAWAPRAFASDGEILLNQATAARNGGAVGTCAPQPNYLITLCTSGSYKLSGSLTAADGQNGVYVTASGVTLDLNGFTINGPGATIVGGAAGTKGQVGLAGVEIGSATVPAHQVTVANGMIQGFDVAIKEPQMPTSSTDQQKGAGGIPPPSELVVRGAILQYGTDGIEAPSTLGVLVEDSVLLADGADPVYAVDVTTGLITRVVIDAGAGTGVSGTSVAVNNSLLRGNNPLGDGISAGSNVCGQSGC